jgi:tetratricopeptide (TPR) repeat protein
MKPCDETHEWTCAQQIRLRALIDVGEPDDLPVELLHQIAGQIHTCCGHGGLKCHRLARGWGVAAAVQKLHDMCGRDPRLKPRGLTERSWRQWEAGDRPDRDYQDLLCRLLETGPVQLGFATDYSPADRIPPPLPLGGREADVVETAASEAVKHAEHADITEVGPGGLERLRSDVTRLAADYVSTSPLPLFSEMHRLRRRTIAALERKSHPDQSAELHLLAGAVCALMANAGLDLGRCGPADELAYAAWTYGHIIGHRPLMGWSRGIQAITAIWTGRYGEAIKAANDGLSYLRSGPGAARLHLIKGRALAESDAAAAREALIRADAVRCEQTADELGDDLGGEFAFEAAKQCYYQALTYTVLRDFEEAEQAATTAVELYRDGPAERRSYGCEALAAAQLATVRLRTGRLEAAATAVTSVLRLEPGQRISSVSHYLGDVRMLLAQPDHAASATARELIEQIDGFRAGSLTRALPAPSRR